jgi:hypothetical protein
MIANHTPLTGDDLLQFLDRLEADLEEESGSGQAIVLAERLAFPFWQTSAQI